MIRELHRAFKFRLYPTDVQAAELAEWERQLRRLYNLAQEQRMNALARPRIPHDRGFCPSCGVALSTRAHTSSCAWVDYYRQSREMTAITEEDDQLARVICCARQEMLRDLDKAWQRWRKGLAGKPRFKRRTDSARIYFSTPKHWYVDGVTLALTGKASTVGAIKIRQDRPWPGNAKFSSCHIVRDVDEWYAVFPLIYSVEVPTPPKAAVGINRGIVHAIADSDGRVVDSPKYYQEALEKIQRRARDVARKQKGSKNRAKAALKLAKAHQTVRRQREWFLHDQSSYYAKNYKIIGIEDFQTRKMTTAERKPKRLPPEKRNKQILDVGWYELQRQLQYKSHGGVVAVDPVNLSRIDSETGVVRKTPASGNAMWTTESGSRILGDVNAAKNVLGRALAMEPPAPKSPKATIKIKGRASKGAQTETTGKPPVEACGGDAPVRAPVEAGKGAREGPHPERTVLPKSTVSPKEMPPKHPPRETPD